MKKILISSILTLFCIVLPAQTREFCDRIFTGSLGQVLPYKISFPDDFDPTRSYPMFLFLHGAGERGADNESQVVHGKDVLLNDSHLRHAIVIAPQCPREDYWVNIVHPAGPDGNASRVFPEYAPISSSLAAVKELMDAYIALGFIDTDRIFGSGLSMGGFGILDLAARYPDFFKGVEPICGGINVKRMEKYRGRTAFRFFHGLKDDIVPPRFSQEACAALAANGINASIIEYPDNNHNSWDSAFSEPDYISWFFEL